jgi:5'-deoxynucleotidase YfbR-like HD superfamily hydrolase
MNSLIDFFSILQLTKEQPLTGYLLAGLKLHETSTLAEHHYTTAMMGYFLGQKIVEAGGKLDVQKVMVMAMIHDLSELFGGDIAGPLNRKYPELREYKDKIGEKAILLLSEYIDGDEKERFMELWEEMENGETDESIITKIVDQLDHQFFLEHLNYRAKYNTEQHGDYRPGFMRDHVLALSEKIKDEKTKEVVEDFFKTFMERAYNKGFRTGPLVMSDGI